MKKLLIILLIVLSGCTSNVDDSPPEEPIDYFLTNDNVDYSYEKVVVLNDSGLTIKLYKPIIPPSDEYTEYLVVCKDLMLSQGVTNYYTIYYFEDTICYPSDVKWVVEYEGETNTFYTNFEVAEYLNEVTNAWLVILESFGVEPSMTTEIERPV